MTKPDARETKITAAYQAGQSLRAIAHDHDTNPENIRRTLTRLGVQLRPAGRPPPPPSPAPPGWFNPKALRTQRERLKISRAELADRAGISPRTLERLENPSDLGGKQRNLKPSVATLHALADALETDATALMKGTKNLRWSRIAAGHDARSFAEALHISTQKLSDIERGKQKLPLQLHDQAAQLLAINIETLTRRLGY